MNEMYRNLMILLILALGVSLVFVWLRARMGITGAGEVASKIKAGALVLDVRTPQEFVGAHYNAALNIPLDQLELRLAELPDKNQPIVVYCASGARSASARILLLKAGYRDVTNAGGLGDIPK